MTICLNMIVRDEAHVVAEALACAAPHIDTWVVVDTGSTDATISLISSFFAARGIRGEIHERPWVNFGANRTEALTLCADKADYIWVIDADDLIVGDLDLTNLTLDSYLLRYGSEFRFWRKQIFRSNLRWKYEGVLHEYPVCLDSNFTEGRLDGNYHINSRRLGSRSRRADKYQRDADLLLEVVTENPDDARNTFYLAQSYRDAGNPEEALKYYRKRASMGGWDEEVFYSLLQCGECIERAKGPWNEALDAYLASWQSRPQRAEPLYRIARHYRSEGSYDLAHLFASRARQIPLPENDILFVGAGIYDWQIDDELSIINFYRGEYRDSFDLSNRLLDLPSVEEADRERILANRDFSAAHVKDDEIGYPDAIVRRLVENRGQGQGQGITLTITTCRRYELFEKTVNSFLNCCLDLDLITRWICIDDGSSDVDRQLMAERYPFFDFIFKERSDKGHTRSMNMLLERIGDSPFWLHLEDDWQFIVRDNYLGKFLAILEDDPTIGQVLFNRNYSETLECRKIQGGSVRQSASGRVRYRMHEHLPPGSRELSEYLEQLPPGATSNAWWPHYSLRPSLSRVSAIRQVGDYDEGSDNLELDFGQRYYDFGYRSAFLDSINCLHIGRLTSERGRVPNAYDLNDEPQFGIPASRAYRVKLLANWASSSELCHQWDRQSKGHGRWENIQVTADEHDVDYWAIINHPPNENERFDPRRTIVFQMEPARAIASWGKWSSPDEREFLQVRSHTHFRNNSEWHLARSYHELLSLPVDKSKVFSCVVSGKTNDPGQRLRIGFLKYLEECGSLVDIFGFDNIHGFSGYQGALTGHNKNDGILPYQYTLAVENNAEVNYFTEKIIDGILGECLCFYWGCPNIEDYIDEAAFIRLPLDDFAESRAIIERAIRDNERERRLEAIRREKRRILDEYQFFPTISRIIRGHQMSEKLEIKVINLDRRSDRWNSFQTEAERTAGRHFLDRCQRVAAVDGTSLVMDSSIETVFRGNDFNFRRGIIACALSHIAIWKDLASGENGMCLVLEDDARLSPGFYGQLVEVCGSLSAEHSDFDLVFLGYQVWPEYAANDATKQHSPRVKPMEWRRYLGGTHGYLVTAGAARRLLAMVEDFGVQNGIDWFLMRNAQGMKVLECVPQIVTADLALPGSSADSDIQHDFESVKSGEKEDTREEKPIGAASQSELTDASRLSSSLRNFLTETLSGHPVPWPDGISPVETENFIAYTDKAGIQPFLSQLIRSSTLDFGLPIHVTESLQRRRLMETINARIRTDETATLVDTFHDEGIRVLVLKGTALGHLIYEQPGLRPACDVDLMVSSDSSPAAKSILRSKGYEESTTYFRQVTFRKVGAQGVPCCIDLHGEISESVVFNRKFSFEELYRRSVPVPGLGINARGLCNVDMLLHLCMHIAQHREWERLIWLCDINLIAQNLSEAEINEFIDLAKRKRISSICARALYFARNTFAARWRSARLMRFASRSFTLSQLIEPSAHYLATRNLLVHDFLLLMRSGSGQERQRLLGRILLQPSRIKRLEHVRLPEYFMPLMSAHRHITSALTRWLDKQQVGSSRDKA